MTARNEMRDELFAADVRAALYESAADRLDASVVERLETYLRKYKLQITRIRPTPPPSEVAPGEVSAALKRIVEVYGFEKPTGADRDEVWDLVSQNLGEIVDCIIFRIAALAPAAVIAPGEVEHRLRTENVYPYMHISSERPAVGKTPGDRFMDKWWGHQVNDGNWVAMAADINAALAPVAPGAIPEGWQLVPRLTLERWRSSVLGHGAHWNYAHLLQTADEIRELLAAALTPAAPGGDEAAVQNLVRDALNAAKTLIANGIELGYIRMPDPSTPDSAHDTLPLIRAALRAISPAGGR